MARTYDDQTKADAVALYVEHGLAEAHRRTEIPKNTIKLWARKAGHEPSEISAHAVAKTKAAVEARTAGMAEKRAALVDRLMVAAHHHVEYSMDATDGVDAKGWMTAGAIALDKVRLEMGEATSLTAVVDAPERTPDQEAELERVLHLVEDAA